MIKKNITLVIMGVSVVLSGTPVLAQGQKSLQGCYTATRGHVETLAISMTQQLGTYRVVFKHNDWTSLTDEEKMATKKRFVTTGPILGTINLDPNSGEESVSHVMSDKERRGFFISQDDTFMPTDIPEPCTGGGGIIYEGIETIHVVAGTGIYSGLDPYQSNEVKVEGTINTCSGKNDFEVIAGQICFQ